MRARGFRLGCDDDLGRWRNRENFRQCSEALCRAVGIRRPKVDNGDGDGFLPNKIDCFLAGSGRKYPVVGKGPAKLT